MYNMWANKRVYWKEYVKECVTSTPLFFYTVYNYALCIS